MSHSRRPASRTTDQVCLRGAILRREHPDADDDVECLTFDAGVLQRSTRILRLSINSIRPESPIPNRYHPGHCPQCEAKLPLAGFYQRTLADVAFERGRHYGTLARLHQRPRTQRSS